MLSEALAVWNRALRGHRETVPYRQIVARCETMLGNRQLPVCIFASHEAQPAAHFAIEYRHGQFELTSERDRSQGEPWNVSVAYLREVVQNAEQYARHPERLDWQWLTDRLVQEG
jgi:hypothetical protein